MEMIKTEEKSDSLDGVYVHVDVLKFLSGKITYEQYMRREPMPNDSGESTDDDSCFDVSGNSSGDDGCFCVCGSDNSSDGEMTSEDELGACKKRRADSGGNMATTESSDDNDNSIGQEDSQAISSNTVSSTTDDFPPGKNSVSTLPMNENC